MTPTAPEQAAYISIPIPMRPIVRARETHHRASTQAYMKAAVLPVSSQTPPTLRTPRNADVP